MSYFILIRGPLGCGKTTIAKKLARELKASYISIDQVLEKHGLDKIPPKEPSIPLKNFLNANKLVLPQARTDLEKGKIVIFDACFYNKEVIEDLIENLKYSHYIFTLKAPIELCIERDKGRKRVYGEDAARAVHKMVSRFDYGIVIDVSDTLEKSVKEILKYLPNNN